MNVLKNHTKVLIIGLVMLLSACAKSEFMLNRGKQSYLEQNYRQAFLRLEPVARAGNAEAQYAVAFMYFYGRGVIEDKEKAIQWMLLAKQQNYPRAIEALKLIQRAPKSKYRPSPNPNKRPL